MNSVIRKNIEAKDENTFLYQLHEESVFDETLWQEYIENVSLINAENTEKEMIIATIELNEYIICTAIHHYDSIDLFVMKNFPSDMGEHVEQIRNENSRLLRML